MSTLRLQHCTVDLDLRRLVRSDGSEEVITTLDADLLRYLVAHAGEVVTYEDLLVQVWQFREAHPRGVVQTALSRLRTLIGDDPKRPVHLFTVRGTGYRFEVPVAAAPPPRPAPSTPRAATAFVGREAELALVTDALAGGERLITLLGLGGLGKTRLAMEVAARGEGPHWFADLTRAETLDAMCVEMANALGVALDAAADTRASVERIGRALAALDGGVVVLDNLEQLVEVARPAVEQWRAAAPQVSLLATSRLALGMPGETRIPLAPMANDDAVSLLLDRALRVAPGFDAAPDVLASLVRHLDGIPLAIELLAARANVLSAAEMLSMMDARFSVLRRRGGGRHDNLREVLEWSWQQLDETAQAAVAQLSVFRGGFDATAAIAVWKLPGDAFAIDVLSDLADHAWLHHRPRGLHLLETIREFAAEQLVDAEATHARHAAWALAMAEEATADLDRDGLDRLVRHHANLSAARRWASRADPPAAARLVLAEVSLVRAHGGPLGPLAQAMDEVLDALADDDPRRGELLVRRAAVAGDLGAPRQAEVLLRQALDAGARQPDVDLLAARFAYSLPKDSTDTYLDEAAERYAAAMRGYQALGDVAGAYTAAYRVAYTRFLAGAWDEALDALRPLVMPPDADHPRTVVVQVLLAVARCHGRLGRLIEALAGFDEALGVLSDDTHRLAAECLEGMAWIHSARGRYERALEAYERVLVLHRRYDDRWGEASVLNDMADVHRRAGNLDEAEALYLESLRRKRVLGARGRAVNINLALVQIMRGRPKAARQLVEEVLATALDPAWAYACHAVGLACADEDGWAMHREAIERLAGARFVDADLATAFELAARRAMEAGHGDRAAWAWQLAASQRQDLGDEVTAAANGRNAARALAPSAGGQVL